MGTAICVELWSDDPVAGEGEKAPHRGELARRRAVGDRVRAAPAGEERTQLGRVDRAEAAGIDQPGTMFAEETDQPVGGGDIGTDRMCGAETIAAQMLAPRGGEGGGGMIVKRYGSSHRPTIRANVAPRKASSSEPCRVSKRDGAR